LDNKEKKHLIRARARKTQIIIQHAKLHQQQRDIQLEAQIAAFEATTLAEETPGTQVWSAKTQDIRNRITGKKRQATERWNRFAGTADAGAMGR
jgi:hypothetical protein